MIKLKDLIIEGWNSNIWPSNIWNSDIWNSDIWPSHVWEGQEQLNEVMDFRNFWVLPSGQIEEVDDHLNWFTDNIETEFYHDENGIITFQDGTIAEPGDVYEKAGSMGYIRITQEIKNDGPLEFDYIRSVPPTQRQMKAMKDLALENHLELKDVVTGRMIDLS